MWEQELGAFLQGYIDTDVILSSDLVGVNESSMTGIAIVVMLDESIPPKAIEKYYFLAKRNEVISFYEMDKLPSRL